MVKQPAEFIGGFSALWNGEGKSDNAVMVFMHGHLNL